MDDQNPYQSGTRNSTEIRREKIRLEFENLSAAFPGARFDIPALVDISMEDLKEIPDAKLREFFADLRKTWRKAGAPSVPEILREWRKRHKNPHRDDKIVRRMMERRLADPAFFGPKMVGEAEDYLGRQSRYPFGLEDYPSGEYRGDPEHDRRMAPVLAEIEAEQPDPDLPIPPHLREKFWRALTDSLSKGMDMSQVLEKGTDAAMPPEPTGVAPEDDLPF